MRTKITHIYTLRSMLMSCFMKRLTVLHGGSGLMSAAMRSISNLRRNNELGWKGLANGLTSKR
jgi:hypothetical protein